MSARRFHLDLTDLDELLGTEEPPASDWIIDGYLERGSHTLLCGRGGKGKTMFLNQLCTRPDELEIALHAEKIIWLDAEMGALGTQRRYWRTKLRDRVIPGRITYANGQGFDVTDPDHWDQLNSAVEGADLVIIDSLKKICRNVPENSADEMSAVVQDLSDLAHESDAAILTIHHQGGDPNKWFRGSTAILDAADSLIAWLPHIWTNDGDDGLRRLVASGAWAKVRHTEAEKDRWFQQGPHGLFMPSGPPEKEVVGKWDRVIEGMLPFEGTKGAFAEACDTNLGNRAWADAYKRVAIQDGNHHTKLPGI